MTITAEATPLSGTDDVAIDVDDYFTDDTNADTLCGHPDPDPTRTTCGDTVCGDCHARHLADCLECAYDVAAAA